MSQYSYVCKVMAMAVLALALASGAAEAAGPYAGSYPGGYYPGYFSGNYSGYSPGSSYYLGRPYPRSSGGFPGGYYPGYFADANNSYPSNAYRANAGAYVPPAPYVNAYRPAASLSGAPYGASPARQVDEGTPATEVNGAAAGGVTVTVHVPADAEVWFDGDATTQQGERREFASPALTQGKAYSYQIRARWTVGGDVIYQTRTVVVHANDRVEVDFSRASPTSRP